MNAMKRPQAPRPAEKKPDPVSRARALLREDGSPDAAPDRRALEAYASWLFFERRLLCLQLYPHLGGRSDAFVLGGNAGDNWHFDGWNDPQNGARRDPASRAASILDLAGVDWRAKRRQDPDLIEIPDTGARPPLPTGWPAADAEIEELARQVVAAVDAYDALLTQDDEHPDLPRLAERENALVVDLARTEPLTIAGLLAKARVAQRLGDDIMGGMRGRLFYSLAEDIMRLVVPLEAIGAEPDPIPALIEAHREAATQVTANHAERAAIEAREPRLYPVGQHIDFDAFVAANPDFRVVLDRQQPAWDAEQEAFDALLRAAASQPTISRTLARYGCEFTEQRDGPAIGDALPAYRVLAAFAGLPCLHDENGEPIPAAPLSTPADEDA